MSTKAFKSEKISQMKEKIEKAKVAIVTDYKGLSVEEITKLRRSIQKEDGDYMVTKNTLAKIAVKGTEYEVYRRLNGRLYHGQRQRGDAGEVRRTASGTSAVNPADL